MQLMLTRDTFTDKCSIGTLTVDGTLECHTLEDVVRPVKIAGQTAIPEGEYTVVINFSNRFQRQLPQLLDVPQFTGIRIHPGNTDKDTDGCILVGTTRGGDVVGQSRVAFDKLFDKLQGASQRGEQIRIRIARSV
jgi:hypothetical protein